MDRGGPPAELREDAPESRSAVVRARGTISKTDDIAFEVDELAATIKPVTGGSAAGGNMLEAVADKRAFENVSQNRARKADRPSVLTRKRFQFAGALLL